MPYESFQKTNIDGVFLIQPKVFGDERGWYCPELETAEFEQNTGLCLNIRQIASSYNLEKGVLRGMHYQIGSNSQGKLVQVVSGAVLDVAVDLRRKSPTFKKVVTAKLTSKEHNQLWVPPGCAHGYIALEGNTRFNYIVTDGSYDQVNERGLNPFDPDLSIDWIVPRGEIQIKDRDLNWPNLSNIKEENLF